jgi:ElaB/YqjD/DUF883 family membrane-anchored ribosome-binding protein
MPNTSTKAFTDTPHGALREQTERVLSEARELGSVAAHATSEKLDTAKERGRALLSRTKDESLKARDGLEDIVRSHPMRSLLIAAGVGAVLAVMFRR